MGELYKKRYRIDSIRIKKYDYSNPGWYFITICSSKKQPWFGWCKNERVCLSKVGEKAYQFWQKIPEHNKNVDIGEFIVMPDHMHGIIRIKDRHKSRRDAPWRVCTGVQGMVKGSLSVVVNQYKGSVKRWCNQNGFDNFKWQSNYYESIIRSEKHLFNVRRYIKNNPKKWFEKRES